MFEKYYAEKIRSKSPELNMNKRNSTIVGYFHQESLVIWTQKKNIPVNVENFMESSTKERFVQNVESQLNLLV